MRRLARPLFAVARGGRRVAVAVLRIAPAFFAGLIVLFVSAPVLVTTLARGRLSRKERPQPKPEVMSGG